VGPQRLAAFGLILSLVGASACGGRAEPAVAVPVTTSHNTQIVRALTFHERRALVERFRARNGPSWEVNEAALMSTTVVDPFVGFLRRARRAPSGPPIAAPLTDENALLWAGKFVRQNADLLGIPQHQVITLVPEVRPVTAEDHASLRAAKVVHFETMYPTKGYETFKELENEISLDVVIADDGMAESFANVSKLHPRMTIDPRPILGEDDPRLYSKLIGRKVFALVDDEKLDLGTVGADDFMETRLLVDISPGTFGMWLTYRLAWMVVASRRIPDGAGFFFFVWLVDTDTGDIIREARVPTHELPEIP
jgi:hypothetical protein